MPHSSPKKLLANRSAKIIRMEINSLHSNDLHHVLRESTIANTAATKL
jgi:hypothetical protein